MSTKQKKFKSAAGTAEASASASAPKAKRARATSSKRIGIGDALREHGMDERAVAARLINICETARKGKDEVSPSQKLYFDTVKECMRQLESPRGSDRAGDAARADAPIVVQLIHNVPRPQRG